MTNPFALPLTFTPVYHSIVWGGRAMDTWRTDLPPARIEEDGALVGLATIAGRRLNADAARRARPGGNPPYGPKSVLLLPPQS